MDAEGRIPAMADEQMEEDIQIEAPSGDTTRATRQLSTTARHRTTSFLAQVLQKVRAVVQAVLAPARPHRWTTAPGKVIGMTPTRTSCLSTQRVETALGSSRP